jgi:hypothetical protein
MRLHDIPDEVASNEPRTACDKNVHLMLVPLLLKEKSVTRSPMCRNPPRQSVITEERSDEAIHPQIAG